MSATAQRQTESRLVGEVLAALARPEGRADPYPQYTRLRAFGPAAIAPDGSLVVSGYRLAAAVLRDHRLEKHPEPVLIAAGHANWRERPALRLMFESMLLINPPAHTRLRRLVSGAFTMRRVAALAPAVRRIVAELVTAMSGPVDFVQAFAFPLPVTVIGELLGIPEVDRPMFQTLVRDWTNVLDRLDADTVNRADPAAVLIADYLTDLADERRKEPRTDLVSALVVPVDGEPGMTGEEVVTMAALLLAAGFETTTGLLSNGLLALLNHPEQADELRARPELAGEAVEELLRFDSPVQMLTSRAAPVTIEVAGRELPAGQRVVTVLGAANRDPEVFDEPDRLVLDRGGEPAVSFGGGLHYCLGAPLARLEARLAFPALLTAFPRLALAGEPVWKDGLVLHGHTALPVSAD
jgi:cytochrome P450